MFCGYCGTENAKDYSFCTGCGKPLESATPNHPIQPEETHEENTDTKNFKDGNPTSKYISVTWWKDCEWPWQASSLEGNTLGTYQTELEAATVVAKHHGINVDDLLIGPVPTDTIRAKFELEDKKRLLIKKVLENPSRKTKQSAPPKVPSNDYDFSDPPKKSPPPQPTISDKIREAVGEQKYYVDQFVTFYETGQGIKRWNWAAFLLCPFWFLYRKVYSLFFVYLIACTASILTEMTGVSAFTQLVIGILWAFIWIQITIEANKTYYDNVLKKIENRHER